MESILTSIKQMLGPSAEYEHFDPEIIMHINTVFMELAQIGVGPECGFVIEDDTASWKDFVSDEEASKLFGGIEALKTYMYLKVKLVFDPPSNGSHMEAINKQIDRLEWRLFTATDYTKEGQNG